MIDLLLVKIEKFHYNILITIYNEYYISSLWIIPSKQYKHLISEIIIISSLFI